MIILIIFGLPSIADHFAPPFVLTHIFTSILPSQKKKGKKEYYHSHKYTTKGKNGNLHKKPFFIFF